ncbi:MAG: hypothetical protein GX625_19900 [Clostridiaceae bacterium]|nr:hypothetical protein [Clostridiaceae bacterium]
MSEFKRLTIRTDTCIEPEDEIVYSNSNDPEGMYNIFDLALIAESGNGVEANILYEISARLAAYEDIGSPEEIASLRAQLAESRAREQAAVEDLGLIRGNNAPCLICEFNDMIGCCHRNHCFADNKFFHWRGFREEK